MSNHGTVIHSLSLMRTGRAGDFAWAGGDSGGVMAVRLIDFTFEGVSLLRPVFIETGTYLGDSLESAWRAGFNLLHSIEINADNHRRAVERFAGRPNVHLHLGSSPDILGDIIDPSMPTTLWLDAHYQGRDRREQDARRGECPLLEELRVVFSFDWSPIVLIDDARMFDHRRPPGFESSDWPSLAAIRQAVPERFTIKEHDGVLYCLEPCPRGRT